MKPHTATPGNQDKLHHYAKTGKRLCTYTKEPLEVKGALTATVVYGNQRAKLEHVVVAGDSPSLLGRNWLWKIRLEIRSIITLEQIFERHEDIFKEDLGLVKSAPAKIHINSTAQPKFCKARTVPYALKERVELELEKLERMGIIEPVQFADWAAPIVPVVKNDGSIRICGDYKVTINRAAKVDSYPLPRVEDLFASLGQGKSFSKLDLAHAYQQILLDESSKQYAVINTHKGLYQYNRLPFGVASTPFIFQRTMEGILRGVHNVCIYIDDILITGSTEQEHLKTPDQVLTHLEEAGLRLKWTKVLLYATLHRIPGS